MYTTSLLTYIIVSFIILLWFKLNGENIKLNIIFSASNLLIQSLLVVYVVYACVVDDCTVIVAVFTLVGVTNYTVSCISFLLIIR